MRRYRVTVLRTVNYVTTIEVETENFDHATDLGPIAARAAFQAHPERVVWDDSNEHWRAVHVERVEEPKREGK